MIDLVDLPAEDADTRPWWEATRDRKLVLQRCRACDSFQHPPRAICTACGSLDLGWAPSAGDGIVVSHTTVHRSPGPAFPVPYVIALVSLDEGPVLLTRLTGDGAAECDAPVRLTWEPLPDGRHLPTFEIGKEPSP